ncbi:gliding motility-associated ABC transporter substrate-binding protein GldG [Ancylomarina longa]|uniref:Gliding motility-associated ABC transporter substrate-binding protein GldG n=2 Tax=Ancylomarina longa TaxID=2487017 RepID=A0A434AVU3_9BACT|nr:gliding motility-associated ABC transporter substrate-binding protein GldG [Ancylomarina longa]
MVIHSIMAQHRKSKDLFKLLLSLLVLLVVVFILQFSFFRWDLTSEKRYSLSDNTKELVASLDKDLYFEIYLAGDLPHGFTKLQKACMEMLDELAVYSNKRISYSLINPNDIANPKKRNAFFQQLVERGLKPTSLQEKTKDGSLKQKIIIPGIIVHDQEKETSIHLLKSVAGLSAEQNLNQSIEALEYELTSAIRLLQDQKPKEIGFLTGQGELNEYEVADITASLLQRYEVKRIGTKVLAQDYSRFAALLVAQPRKEFAKADKYRLDQYIMHGGKVLWLIDEVEASMDSLTTKESTVAFYKPLNLEDQLFTYGVRINPDLIMDVQGQLIPIQTALPGEAPKFTPAPWYYSPLLKTPNTNPITKGLNVVKAEFANSIDFVGKNNKLKRQVLLASSDYTKLEKVPVQISLDIVNRKMRPSDFPSGSRNIAVLLDGIFPSVFKNRAWKGIQKSTFKEQSVPTKMIVVSDGDIIRNRVRGSGNNRQIEALGYDRYSRKTYGNSSFLLNCVDYLCDDKGWMNLRSREVKLRLLNPTKIRTKRVFWQMFNLVLPLFLLLIFALFRFYMRRRKFARLRK